MAGRGTSTIGMTPPDVSLGTAFIFLTAKPQSSGASNKLPLRYSIVSSIIKFPLE